MAEAGLLIVYVGAKEGTSLQRANALRSLGHDVVHVESGTPAVGSPRFQLYRVAARLKSAPDVYGANRRMLKAVARLQPDLVWVDKGVAIRASAISRARDICPEAKIVSYSPDDMMNPSNQSREYLRALPLYDLHVTTKSYNVDELMDAGAREVEFIDNAYDPSLHRPRDLGPEERVRYSCDVGFVGFFEKERAELIRGLVDAGVPVTVRGPGWRSLAGHCARLKVRESFLHGDEYVKAINGTRINLGFLRKVNRDLQTTRSIEIPACRAFMLAERTCEHQRLFKEGVEAEFFDGFQELLDKCRYYLENETERRRIAEAGFRRCVESGYSNEARLSRVLSGLWQGSPKGRVQEPREGPDSE